MAYIFIILGVDCVWRNFRKFFGNFFFSLTVFHGHGHEHEHELTLNFNFQMSFMLV